MWVVALSMVLAVNLDFHPMVTRMFVSFGAGCMVTFGFAYWFDLCQIGGEKK